MKKIGIIGQGFVGTAIREGLKTFYDIETYDKFKTEASTCDSLKDLMMLSEVIFVCLPTPMKKDGSCDVSIIEGTIREMDRLATQGVHIAVLKSTVPPGTTDRLDDECQNLSVVFSPEFLTEANFIDDFKNQKRVIIGGKRPASTTVKTIFRKVYPKLPIVKTGSRTAEMVKYFTNCVLATKVSFANEMKQICDKADIDYDKVVEYSLYDDRVGPTHLSVPGPDGRSGFGGSCFPKDINALINFANRVNIEPKVLKAVWEKNLEVRPEKDWEQLKGRAVSEE